MFMCTCQCADGFAVDLRRVRRRLGWPTAYSRTPMSSSQAESLPVCGFGGCWPWGQYCKGQVREWLGEKRAGC